MDKASTCSLDGVKTRINGRHAFVYERTLEFIVRETQRKGGVRFTKADLARAIPCCVQSVDRAVMRLRSEGLIKSRPVFSKSGAQLGNEYRATKKGVKRALEFTPERL